MADLLEFLEARIAEDEQIARNATGDRWVSSDWFSMGGDMAIGTASSVANLESNGGERTYVAQTAYDTFYEKNSLADAAHISLWDPARVLAECAAKRALIEEAVSGDFVSRPEYMTSVRMFAAVYDFHPDFDPTWKT